MLDITKYPYIALDTESTGLVWPRDKMFGFSIATPDGESRYYDIRETPNVIDWLNYDLSLFDGPIIFHNAAFDYRMFNSAGINIPMELIDDTMVRATLINEFEHSYSLDSLCNKYLNERKEDIYDDLAKIFGGKATRSVQMGNLHRAPSELVGKYAAKDAELTLRLWEWQRAEIEKQGIQKICEFERRVAPSLIRTSMRGIRVDERLALDSMHNLTIEIDRQQQTLEQMTGNKINVNSPKQIRALFNATQDEQGEWYTDRGQHVKATDSGSPSFDSESLRLLEGDPRADLILNIRSTIKTRDTFIKGHVLGHMVGDRVYPNINQCKGEDGGTGTGRLSYTEPAMQQIPSRNKKVASIVKPIFLAEEGREWMSLDMNSFEVRVFAHLVNNPTINNKYQDNEFADFHQMVADLTGLVRNATYSGQANAKQLNLSMIFNSGNGAIAEKMGMPWFWEEFAKNGAKHKYKKAGAEAEAVIAEYHRNLPGVKELADRAKRAAQQHGYVQTKHGRRLRFPNGYKTYKASGLAIQATAADINKEMIMLIDDMGRDGDYNLLLNVHDGYGIDIPKGMNPVTVRDELQSTLRNILPWFRIPLIVDLKGVGLNYWDSENGQKD